MPRQALKALSSNSAGNEKVLLSMKLLKINRKGKSQNRVLMVSARHIFNLMPDNYSKVNRCMEIAKLDHLTVSRKDEEFAIHLKDEYDYRFKSPMFNTVVAVLREAFTKVTGAALPFEDVDDVNKLAQQVPCLTLSAAAHASRAVAAENAARLLVASCSRSFDTRLAPPTTVAVFLTTPPTSRTHLLPDGASRVSSPLASDAD